MELRQCLQIVKKRLWLIGLSTLLVAGVSFWVSSKSPLVYHASTSLLVTRGLTDNDSGAIRASEYLALTYKELLTKRPVIEAAAQTLGLDPRETEKKVQVQLIPDTSLIELTVEDNDPHLAMEIANEIVEAFISRESGGIRVRDLIVVEPAFVPAEPGRNTVLHTFLGAFAGFVFSVGLVFLLEYLDDSFETSTDIKQILALPTLGTIPRLRRRERASRLITSTHPHSLVSEAYRTLRTNIHFASVDEPLRTLLITSADLGAGKTTIAANLGVALAQAGSQVVLIDTNLRFPTLHTLFDMPNVTGLTDLLMGNIQNVEECMVKTEIDNLRLITSGPIPPNPSERLVKGMEIVLDKVKKNAELIILDTPAALGVTDAVVLASMVDGVILVIEAKGTSHEVARQTCEILQGVGATILGVTLTKVKVSSKARRTLTMLQKRNQPNARYGNGEVSPPTSPHSAAAKSTGRVPSRRKAKLKKVL